LKLSFNCLMTIIFLMLTAIIVFKYDFFRAISIGLITLITSWLYCYYIAGIIYYSLMYFLIISYYCKLRMNSVNENLKILTKKFMISNKAIDNLLKDHNDICNTINDYNIFWKRIYELTLYGIIPLNLILLHQVFFGDLLLLNRLTFIIAVISYLSLLFVLNFMTASVHKEVSISYRLINLLLLKLSSNLTTRRKIKVIFQINILEKKNYLLKFILYRYFQLWKEWAVSRLELDFRVKMFSLWHLICHSKWDFKTKKYFVLYLVWLKFVIYFRHLWYSVVSFYSFINCLSIL
jgi:hypothetical protein